MTADEEEEKPQHTCEVCEEPLDPYDELANLKVEEMHDNQGWVRYFCCPDHLLAWMHSDPAQLEPHLSLG